MATLGLQASSDFHHRCTTIKDDVRKNLIEEARRHPLESRSSAICQAYDLAQTGLTTLSEKITSEFPGVEYKKLIQLFTNSVRRDFFGPDAILGEIRDAYFPKN